MVSQSNHPALNQLLLDSGKVRTLAEAHTEIHDLLVATMLQLSEEETASKKSVAAISTVLRNLAAVRLQHKTNNK